MSDDTLEQHSYDILSRLEQVRASVHSADAAMRAYFFSGADSDRENYDRQWQLVRRESLRAHSVLGETRYSTLAFDLHALNRSMDKALSARDRDAEATSANLKTKVDRLDRNIEKEAFSENQALDVERSLRQSDFLFTEIFFLITMAAGSLAVLMAAFGAGRDLAGNTGAPSIWDMDLELDLVTGMMFRPTFEAILDQELARAGAFKQPLTLLIVHLDELETVREVRGKEACDKILRRVASILMGAFRASDICCRYSDTEFAIVLPKTPVRNSRVPGERVRSAIEGYEWSGCYIVASIGAAQAKPGETKESLILRTEQATAYARRTGRNRMSIIEPGQLAA